MTTQHDKQTRFTYLTSKQVAFLLGMNEASVRRWRTKNKKLGVIKYGPDYEIHGGRVVYRSDVFRKWCAQTQRINGVLHSNAPVQLSGDVLDQQPLLPFGDEQ